LIFQETNIVHCSIPSMTESKLANDNYCSKQYSEYSLASVVSNDTTTSKFNPIRADLDKTPSQEKQGQTTETLQGTINFGKNIFNPDFKYKVVNGALVVDPTQPLLTLQGVKGLGFFIQIKVIRF